MRRFVAVILSIFVVLTPLAAQTKPKEKVSPQKPPDNPNLVIGKTAPEIVGEDLDGKHFKLSDYRGKVVLLDFWGNW